VPSGVVLILALVGGFCCVKQRALGRRERAIEDAQWEKENAEMLMFRRQMAAGQFAGGSGGMTPQGSMRGTPAMSQAGGSMRSVRPAMPAMPSSYSSVPGTPLSPQVHGSMPGTPLSGHRPTNPRMF